MPLQQGEKHAKKDSEDYSEAKKTEKEHGGYISRLLMAMYEARDPSSLAVLRIAFGFLMVLDIPQERGLSSLASTWGDTEICRFPLFNALSPLPLEWMYMVFLVMFIGAVGIMLGFLFRLSCLAFLISYWYIFFLEKTTWNNHSYLYGLTAIMLLLTNSHYYMSIDGMIWKSIQNCSIPRWQYGLFKFQFIIVYFYAGLKKLDSDWVHGYSMSGLGKHWVFDPFRIVISDEMIDYLVVHLGGLILDLSNGFLLYFDKTRPLGFLFGGSFHLMNSQMFSIGMFPWTMLATMPIFCASDWPKLIVAALPSRLASIYPSSKEAKANVACSQARKGKFSFRQRALASIALLYGAIQIFLPYSHGVTAGYNAWTQGIYGYSWDMMVHVWSTQHIVIAVIDKPSNKTMFLRPGSWLLVGRRNARWSSHPDMIKQYAVCLADRLKSDPEFGVSDPAIYFDIWRAMNGRFQQRLVDPKVDLVTAPWSPFKPAKWIRPMLTELSPWRQKLKKLAKETESQKNLTDIVFVADFPGLYLENYIDVEVKANISVLHGKVEVEIEDRNYTLNVNDTMTVPSNVTHKVYTVSTHPACYMYESQNLTEWKQKDDPEAIAGMSKKLLKKLQWANKSMSEKAFVFFRQKYMIFESSFLQTYYAAQVILHGPDYFKPSSESTASESLSQNEEAKKEG